jgi:hypothetical protein
MRHVQSRTFYSRIFKNSRRPPMKSRDCETVRRVPRLFGETRFRSEASHNLSQIERRIDGGVTPSASNKSEPLFGAKPAHGRLNWRNLKCWITARIPNARSRSVTCGKDVFSSLTLCPQRLMVASSAHIGWNTTGYAVSARKPCFSKRPNKESGWVSNLTMRTHSSMPVGRERPEAAAVRAREPVLSFWAILYVGLAVVD